ncbi:MAG TPA: hypothetical protein PLH29_04665 [bacterium]|nr:hypothetical protein [bacterium]
MQYSRKNKKIFNFFGFALFFLSFVLLVLSPFSFEKAALALQGRYNRTSSDNSITIVDWNYLDDDFLATDGTNSMTGDLNMGNNRITNLVTSAAPANNDGATVQYVQNAISSAASAGGGETFVQWGGGACPAGMNTLYSGVGFSALYSANAGGDNPQCIQVDTSAPIPFTGTYADNMYPIVTSLDAGNLPTSDSTMAAGRIVRCALCHKPTGTCYAHYGTHSCASGFAAAYTGYVLGSFATNGAASHYNSTQRACVNRNFQADISSGGNMGAMWYGTRIQGRLGLTAYSENTFIKCAICCN